MKKGLFYSISALFLLVLTACEGPVGPPGLDGLDGLDGQDGVNILGTVIDIQGTFEASNDYALLYEFPQSVEVFETDIVLVYLLWDQTVDSNNEPVDIWRLLPQTRILNQGLLQYNFDHTFLDVSLFLEADFDLGTLPAGDTDDQVFRIAVIPAEASSNARINFSDMDAVMKLLNVEESAIEKVQL